MTSILTPTTLTPEVVAEIARIGNLRLPAEACGVLLPYSWRGQQVWEMPNRSKTPHNTFAMKSDDIVVTLTDWSREENLGWESLTLWHTHPTGSSSPSKADLENRTEHCGNLLVGLSDPPLATWF